MATITNIPCDESESLRGQKECLKEIATQSGFLYILLPPKIQNRSGSRTAPYDLKAHGHLYLSEVVEGGGDDFVRILVDEADTLILELDIDEAGWP